METQPQPTDQMPIVTPDPIPAPPAQEINKGDSAVPEIPAPPIDPVVPAPSAPTVKSGVKTTEFWLNLAVQAGALLTLIQQTATNVPGNDWVKIVAVIGAVLSSLGYSRARAQVKAAALTIGQGL